MSNKKNTIPLPEKMIYASGDLFGGGGQTVIAVIYMIFLTDIIGVNPAWAGLVIMLSKIWDAISDPLMGMISDNTRSKYGRRKPYIFVGGILLLFAMLLLWYPITFESEVLKIMYVIVTYLFYSTISTVISIPYSSLSTELSPDFDETNKVNILRLVFSLISTAICSIIPVAVFDMVAKNQITVSQFYFIIAIGFGIFFALPLMLTGFFSKERVVKGEKTKFSFSQYFQVFKIDSFKKLLGLYLCQAINLDITSSIVLYYSLYIVKGMDATIFMASFLVSQLIIMPYINKKVETTSKSVIYYYGLPLSIICALIIGLFPADGNVILLYVATGLMAFGFAGAQTMCWLIFADIVDVVQLGTGERIAGSLSGAMTFIRKVASAIAIFVLGIVLSFTGYIKPIEDMPNPTQPYSTIIGLRVIFIFSWVVIMGIGFVIAKKFDLSPEISKRVKFLVNKGNLTVDEEKEKDKYIKKYI